MQAIDAQSQKKSNGYSVSSIGYKTVYGARFDGIARHEQVNKSITAIRFYLFDRCESMGRVGYNWNTRSNLICIVIIPDDNERYNIGGKNVTNYAGKRIIKLIHQLEYGYNCCSSFMTVVLVCSDFRIYFMCYDIKCKNAKDSMSTKSVLADESARNLCKNVVQTIHI